MIYSLTLRTYIYIDFKIFPIGSNVSTTQSIAGTLAKGCYLMPLFFLFTSSKSQNSVLQAFAKYDEFKNISTSTF